MSSLPQLDGTNQCLIGAGEIEGAYLNASKFAFNDPACSLIRTVYDRQILGAVLQKLKFSHAQCDDSSLQVRSTTNVDPIVSTSDTIMNLRAQFVIKCRDLFDNIAFCYIDVQFRSESFQRPNGRLSKFTTFQKVFGAKMIEPFSCSVANSFLLISVMNQS